MHPLVFADSHLVLVGALGNIFEFEIEDRIAVGSRLVFDQHLPQLPGRSTHIRRQVNGLLDTGPSVGEGDRAALHVVQL